MYSKQDLLKIFKEQLAIENNCSIDDFNNEKNVITTPQANAGIRHFIDGTFFLKMVTLGSNAVISADNSLHDWLLEFTKDKAGHHLFEHTNLAAIDNQLKQYSKRLWQTHHMFIPDMKTMSVSNDYPVKWFEQDEIHQFYINKQFPNAFCEKFIPERPDVLAVAAYDGNTIIGMAGCSADTPILWQIGIDVNKNYRGKGVGTYLVTLLKNEIIKRDKIPYYGTSLSNLHSWNIALNSGFIPAWVETETIE